VLLVALVSGLLVHWKDLVRQLWQFRPHLRLRYSISDAHKVLSVFGLPFGLMYGWSGAVIGLFGLFGAALTQTNFDGDAGRIEELRGGGMPEREAKRRTAKTLPLATLATSASRSLGTTDAPNYVWGVLHQDEHAWVAFWYESGGLTAERAVALDAVRGDVLQVVEARHKPAHGIERVLFDLHYARVGGMLMKALYSVLALFMCVVIVTGNLIWLERRDAGRASRGNRMLERLTVGVSCGLAFGIAVYFAVNRSLPAQLAGRADLEFTLFLGAWLLGAIAAAVPRWSARAAAAALCAGAGALFLGVVLADLALLDANLITAVSRGLPAVFACELLLLVLAALCIALACVLARRHSARPDTEEP
jgi:uncharacterized iron-regulated membrane protein